MIKLTMGQPDPEWVHYYNFGNYECINDIYLTIDGSYVACGYTKVTSRAGDPTSDFWIVKVSDLGELEWSGSYGTMNVYEFLTSIIETDEGGFISGGYTRRQGMTALMTNGDGEQIWLRSYGGGQCNAIIELKSGEFVLAGRGRFDDNDQGYVVCINRDGGVIWSRQYEGGARDEFYAMRETEGGIMLLGHSWRGNEPHLVWLQKINFAGEIIFSNLIEVGPSPFVRDMVSDSHNGFAIAGFQAGQSDGLMIKVNEVGEIQWHRLFNWGNDNLADRFESINRLNDGGYSLVGSNINCAVIFQVEPGGNEIWHRIYGDGSFKFFSSVTCWDQSTIAGGRAMNREGNTDGLIMKLIPERSGPIIIDYTPEELEFSTLPDTVLFAVYSIDLQLDSLRYMWFKGEDTLSTDSSAIVLFDATGDFEIDCAISDGEMETTINWNVQVLDFFLRSFSPEENSLSVRRTTSIDFSIEVAVAEGEEVEYNWILTHRNQEIEEIGVSDSVSVIFNEAGEHELQATVTYGELSEQVNWLIDVHSSIWSWWPVDLELIAYVDSTQDFVITPFNENSDSLIYDWYVNDMLIDDDTPGVELTFPEVGQFMVTSIVYDGEDADTIRWSVNVEEWSFTANEADLVDLPTSPVLYPASPNPFNSAVKLSMYLPKQNHVSLSVFDLNGREVSRLVDGNVGAGNQTFVWDAIDFPAGVYIVRMDAGDVSVMRKVVLVR